MPRKADLVATYTSDSLLRSPKRLMRIMWMDLQSSRELAWTLFVRDIKAQYRQSFLGFFWAFVPAISIAVGLSLAKRAGIVNLGETEIPYPAYVLISMTLWQTFVEALRAPLGAIQGAKPVMAKLRFPPEAAILSKIMHVLFNLAIKSILIVGAIAWFRIEISWSAVLFIVAIVHLIAFGVAAGLFLIPLGGLYQDINLGLNFVISGWLFLTPVVYSPPKESWFSSLVALNPVTPLLVTSRELLTGADLSHVFGFWVVSLMSVIGLVLGLVVCKLSLPFLVERASV